MSDDFFCGRCTRRKPKDQLATQKRGSYTCKACDRDRRVAMKGVMERSRAIERGGSA